MIIYYAPILFLLISLIFLHVKGKGIQYTLSMLLVFFVTIITGSHYYSVSDYENYAELYSAIPDISALKITDLKYYYGEVGFVYLISLLKYINLPFVLFTLLLSFVSIVLKSYFFFKFNRLVFYSLSIYLCMYFILVEFIVIRWSVAVGLILVGYYFIFLKKRKMGLLFLLSSFVFHYFSLFFILVSFVVNRFFSLKIYICIFVLSVIFSSVLNNLDWGALIGFNTSVTTKIAYYMLEKDTEVGFISRAKLIVFSTLILCYLALTPRGRIDLQLRFLINVSMIFVCFSILFFELPALFQRTTVVTDIFCIATFVRILEDKWKGNSLYFLCVLSFISTMFIIWSLLDVFNSYQVRVWEYKSWFMFLY